MLAAQRHKIKLLDILRHTPNQDFSVNELSKRAHIRSSTVSRIMKELLKDDAVQIKKGTRDDTKIYILKKTSATPHTLRTALENGIDTAPEPRHTHLTKSLEVHVRDFLAQKFCIASLKATPESTELVESLWESITGQPWPGRANPPQLPDVAEKKA